MAADADRFPGLFTGFGPIPAIRGVRLHAPLAVGSTRSVHNADGTVLEETIIAHDPPVSHAYTLSGFSAAVVVAGVARRGQLDHHRP